MSRFTKGCKWPVGEGHGGPRKDGTIIEVGLALALWNQDLSNGWGQSAREKIECRRGAVHLIISASFSRRAGQ